MKWKIKVGVVSGETAARGTHKHQQLVSPCPALSAPTCASMLGSAGASPAHRTPALLLSTRCTRPSAASVMALDSGPPGVEEAPEGATQLSAAGSAAPRGEGSTRTGLLPAGLTDGGRRSTELLGLRCSPAGVPRGLAGTAVLGGLALSVSAGEPRGVLAADARPEAWRGTAGFLPSSRPNRALADLAMVLEGRAKACR